MITKENNPKLTISMKNNFCNKNGIISKYSAKFKAILNQSTNFKESIENQYLPV